MERRIAVTVTIVAVLVFLARPHFEWVSKATDSVGLILLGLAMLPWLGSILESFSITGFGEAKFREMDQRIANAEEAIDTSQDIIMSPNLTIESSTKLNKKKHTLMDLASEYVSARNAMRSGNERTAKMAALFKQMTIESAKIGQDGFDIQESLISDNAGENLAAVAHAYSFPEHFNLGSIIELVKTTKQPFLQFWGLRAIQRKISAVGVHSLSIDNIAQLRGLQSYIRPNTDRAYTMGRILKALDLADGEGEN